MLRNFFLHLHTINKHRFLVMRNCFMMGLYWQGLVHDLSKYSLVEFWPGVRYYQGFRSPIDQERKEKGYSQAWLHHKGHNRHHWQYWMDQDKEGNIYFIDPPIRYVKEMVADRIAACMVYQKEKYHPASALEFLHAGRETPHIPEKTRAKLEEYLNIVAQNDLRKALHIIRNMDDN
jgi:hypothetical protein